MSVPESALHHELDRYAFLRTLGWFDWLWAAILCVGSVFAYFHYGKNMDAYEVGILFGTALSVIFLGWSWKPARILTLVVAALSIFSISLYGGALAAAEQNFFLKFMLSSQSAFMWMSALYVMATVTYFGWMLSHNEFTGKVATAMTWSATAMGLIGLMVRWQESYFISPDVGHIPVSNLYEVFILFSIITALLYLYYERKHQTRALGAFVMLVVTAAVAFLLWYTFDREAHEIQPLVPALQSYWMKIHVPANFIGYGAFALAAMVGVMQLMQHYKHTPSRPAAILSVLFVLLVSGFLMLDKNAPAFGLSGIDYWIKFSILSGILLGLGFIMYTDRVQSVYPSPAVVDDVMYKSIALGFAFFTLATILGAMWAAEAWGGYWSWDPKETWALIVWLNYAAWLHLRLTKGWSGSVMSWWAVIGLFVTLFAFLGVNMFLSGLHSYGEL